MPRTVRDAKLETRAARDRLKPGRTPHFKTLIPSKLHLGYRRKKKDLAGKWLVRHYLGNENYHVAPLGIADDFQDAGQDSDVISFADAQRLALEHRVERKRGRGLSVADAIADYVKDVGAERDRTANDAERTAALLILPRLGRIKLADLKTQDIIDWRNALAKEPGRARTKAGKEQKYKAKPATKEQQRARRASVNRVMGVLKAALNRAFKAGDVQDDLAWRRAEPFDKVHAARPGHLSVAECKRMINSADKASGFRDLVQAALQTGCRYGELRALQVRDFQRGKIHIRDSKSGKPRDVVLSDEGIIFFTQITTGRAGTEPMLVNAGRIERERIRREAAKDKAPIDDSGEWRSSEQARPMRDACKHAKIEPEVGFHQLRHTWASLAVMGGMPLMVVARNLGHVDTRMVEKHYGHLTESYVDEQVRSFAPTFGTVETANVKSMRGR